MANAKNMVFTEKFPERLRAAMDSAYISQSQLARETGISQASISQYVLGQRFPRIKSFYKIAETLGVNPQWLMGHDDVQDNDSILLKYGRLDEEDKYKVHGYADALLCQPKYTGRDSSENQYHLSV